MKQFYETYKDSQILSALLRELSWTNNLLVMSRAKTEEERISYIKLAIDEKYSYRELDCSKIPCLTLSRIWVMGGIGEIQKYIH
jgi:hypothetical protein